MEIKLNPPRKFFSNLIQEDFIQVYIAGCGALFVVWVLIPTIPDSNAAELAAAFLSQMFRVIRLLLLITFPLVLDFVVEVWSISRTNEELWLAKQQREAQQEAQVRKAHEGVLKRGSLNKTEQEYRNEY